MNQKEAQDILIEILSLALHEDKAPLSLKEKLTPQVLMSVCRLAKEHDLAHIIAKFIYENNIEVAPELWAKLQKEEILSVMRYEQQKYTLSEICKAFDEAKISYIPLKGPVIRPYYPYESMRTSCDIDILIHETDLDLAVSKLQNIGYRAEDRHFHDISLFSPKNVHLELHFSIKENMENLDSVLADVWDYVDSSEGSKFSLKKEFFVFQIFSHMAHHFITGGCGIKSLMDIWVLQNKMDAPYTCAEKLLKKARLYKFAEQMSNIADMCFSGMDKDEFSDLVLDYIFKGGVYGSQENKIAVKKSRTDSSLGYIIKTLFLPYKAMTVSYPVLKKAPYLLPFYWIVRWIKAVQVGKTKRMASEFSYANNMSENEVDNIKKINSTLGLD